MLPYDLIIFQIQYSNTYYINGLTGDFEQIKHQMWCN